MEEPVKATPPETPESPQAPPVSGTAPVLAADAPKPPEQPTPTVAPAAPSTTSPEPAPAPKPPEAKPKQDNAATKPILVVVVSMVLFVTLCAVAFYAYGQSN